MSIFWRPRGCVLWFDFAELSGDTVYDLSGNGNHGTIYNCEWRRGHLVGSLYFNGENAYVEVPYSSVINPPEFTVIAFAKVMGGEGTWRSVVTSRESTPIAGYMIYASRYDRWEFWIGDGSTWRALRGPSITMDTWYHLVAWYKDGEMRFYVNNVLYGPVSYTYVQNEECPLRVGAGLTESSPDYFFNGLITHFRIYNRALTLREIRAHYHYLIQGYIAHPPFI